MTVIRLEYLIEDHFFSMLMDRLTDGVRQEAPIDHGAGGRKPGEVEVYFGARRSET